MQPAPSLWRLSGARRARLRIRTLIYVRWMAVAGQLVTVLLVTSVLRLPLPLAPCLTLIALLAFVNVLVSLAGPGQQRQVADGEATGQLAFDILQLAGMLYLTGGTINPFSLLMIAPVVLAAATLPLRHVLALALLAVVCTILLSVTYMPLPSPDAAPFAVPLINRVEMSWPASSASPSAPATPGKRPVRRRGWSWRWIPPTPCWPGKSG